MKKTLLILVALISTCAFAQTESCCTEPRLSPYISYGLSVTNSSDFKTSSYTGLEVGAMYDNIGAGIVFGRGSLAGMFKQDDIRNYFYEVKAIGTFPLGSLTGSVILGYGGYIDTKHNFIEYGGGISYSVGRVSYGITGSNWDGITYVTPSITFNF
jgi:hypothetical protein